MIKGRFLSAKSFATTLPKIENPKTIICLSLSPISISSDSYKSTENKDDIL
ncbi:hypothetical protein [Arcobacter porcinus]|uniref:hypothetical protein n=1 Tax=Arcobacter porcinus TaxID=1935204 RepID=UPI001CDBDB69|nr:hypothetical protein [Arcobacter porcinus]